MMPSSDPTENAQIRTQASLTALRSFNLIHKELKISVHHGLVGQPIICLNFCKIFLSLHTVTRMSGILWEQETKHSK